MIETVSYQSELQEAADPNDPKDPEADSGMQIVSAVMQELGNQLGGRATLTEKQWHKMVNEAVDKFFPSRIPAGESHLLESRVKDVLWPKDPTGDFLNFWNMKTHFESVAEEQQKAPARGRSSAAH